LISAKSSPSLPTLFLLLLLPCLLRPETPKAYAGLWGAWSSATPEAFDENSLMYPGLQNSFGAGVDLDLQWTDTVSAGLRVEGWDWLPGKTPGNFVGQLNSSNVWVPSGQSIAWQLQLYPILAGINLHEEGRVDWLSFDFAIYGGLGVAQLEASQQNGPSGNVNSYIAMGEASAKVNWQYSKEIQIFLLGLFRFCQNASPNVFSSGNVPMDLSGPALGLGVGYSFY
jgi:hypothetical protein